MGYIAIETCPFEEDSLLTMMNKSLCDEYVLLSEIMLLSIY